MPFKPDKRGPWSCRRRWLNNTHSLQLLCGYGTVGRTAVHWFERWHRAGRNIDKTADNTLVYGGGAQDRTHRAQAHTHTYTRERKQQTRRTPGELRLVRAKAMNQTSPGVRTKTTKKQYCRHGIPFIHLQSFWFEVHQRLVITGATLRVNYVEVVQLIECTTHIDSIERRQSAEYGSTPYCCRCSWLLCTVILVEIHTTVCCSNT